LRASLAQSAPAIRIAPPPRQNRLSVDGQLWYAFAKLNDALGELEVHQIRAMPPHEREARFHSARLARRLTGAAAESALAQLGLPDRAGRRIYELGAESREVKFRPGDFNCALAPENVPGFLDRRLAAFVRGTPLEGQYGGGVFWQVFLEDVTSVSVVAL